MRLEPCWPIAYHYPGAALDAAIAARADNRRIWIIAAPENGGYLVCEEATEGRYAVPVCMAWIGVFEETDRFTDPIFRINLGPGVWPVE